jgi:hypothetical protein
MDTRQVMNKGLILGMIVGLVVGPTINSANSTNTDPHIKALEARVTALESLVDCEHEVNAYRLVSLHGKMVLERVSESRDKRIIWISQTNHKCVLLKDGRTA